MAEYDAASERNSQTPTPEASQQTPTPPQTPFAAGDVNLTSSLEDMQTNEQRRILDTVAQVRKCGLESILSLPQLVVCGDQSAGKSSVLEALTEIPFPRNDNLCTRFATEIILRRANVNSLTIKVIPDASRPVAEQSKIKAFEESITNFEDLPRIMGLAMAVMGLASTADSDTKPRAFAKDVLSIVIEGPARPQLTLVDIPGLIATSTRGVTKADVDMVAEITDHYIKQHRTICLAVVSATNDYANQKILEKVRDVDPDGDRTLGIITKPDGVAPGSGAEKGYLELARNEDIFFKLGWHVLKNRKFEEREFSLVERNASEATFFRTSNFKTLPPSCVGIDALRSRLSLLLFEHVKRELPKLRQDLEAVLHESRTQLALLGQDRSSPVECKAYLTQLSLAYHQLCKAAIDGHYEGEYFRMEDDSNFALSESSTIRRTRAVVQQLNTKFANFMQNSGAKYHIDMNMENATSTISKKLGYHDLFAKPQKMSKPEALSWVREVLIRNRGKELVGNYNPLLIGELFWDQSIRWKDLAKSHMESVADVCSRFLQILLRDSCPSDVEPRVWSSLIEEALNDRLKAANAELEMLSKELRNYPINYNHYYTETITARRRERQKADLAKCIEDAKTVEQLPDYQYEDDTVVRETINVDQAVENFFDSHDPDMEDYSCEEALDCLFAIYKVSPRHCLVSYSFSYED
jgi:GTPase SAR1 family protein